MRDFEDFLKALGLFIVVPFLALCLILFAMTFTRYPSATFGDESTIGARIYLNGEFAGLMEKYKYRVSEDEYTDVRLCRWVEKGDHLRAEKEGYKIYSATLEPSYDDSGSPWRWVSIELTPLAHDEKAKGR